MSSKRQKTVIIAILSVIIISNTAPVSFILGFIFQDRIFYGFDFFYNSGQCGFSNRGLAIENHEELISEFKKYSQKNPSDSILYRTFKIYPLKFWFWKEYIFDPKYRLPYKEPCKNL
ncbi:hypothetical protein DYBT9275_00148 [Dyadobacter sp. CECT 9275]|uniref:Uncharacterized protein n=1 Tax=Dyadobacter helix TaxID=2822344 RepID=A0A916J806_9BACT|nr:hypothetical protein [Dyadobacter sp. CECT 9275]CAG4988739.1 hypothetical protein DYBT9275_00148 [Dyadobacter sp. CECT 9275]